MHFYWKTHHNSQLLFLRNSHVNYHSFASRKCLRPTQRYCSRLSIWRKRHWRSWRVKAKSSHTESHTKLKCKLWMLLQTKDKQIEKKRLLLKINPYRYILGLWFFFFFFFFALKLSLKFFILLHHLTCFAVGNAFANFFPNMKRIISAIKRAARAPIR